MNKKKALKAIVKQGKKLRKMKKAANRSSGKRCGGCLLFRVLGKIFGILAAVYAILFAVFFFDLDGKLLFYVVEPLLVKHYDKMERKNPLDMPYKIKEA